MRPSSRKHGFTLTELLVAIALMALLATTIGVGLTGGKGRSLETAQREVMGALNVARISAIKGGLLYPGENLTNSKQLSALVINVDNNSEGYLREFGVVVGNANANGTSGFRWRAVGSPMLLPNGIYFVPSLNASEVNADSDVRESGTGVIAMSYPYFQTYTGNNTNVGNNMGTTRQYYCIFFGADGTILDNRGSLNQTFSQNIIMAAAEKNPTATGRFTLDFPDEYQATGVRTVRFGSPIPITDTDDLKRN